MLKRILRWLTSQLPSRRTLRKTIDLQRKRETRRRRVARRYGKQKWRGYKSRKRLDAAYRQAHGLPPDPPWKHTKSKP